MADLLVFPPDQQKLLCYGFRKFKKFGTKVCILLICPSFKVETEQSFVSSSGSKRCTVQIVAMFKSELVIYETKQYI